MKKTLNKLSILVILTMVITILLSQICFADTELGFEEDNIEIVIGQTKLIGIACPFSLTRRDTEIKDSDGDSLIEKDKNGKVKIYDRKYVKIIAPLAADGIYGHYISLTLQQGDHDGVRGDCYTISCKVNVIGIKVESISIPKSVSLKVGEEFRPEVIISPSNATNQGYSLYSSDYSIINTTNGYIWSNPSTSKEDPYYFVAEKAGKTTLTAKSDDGGLIATCEATVSNIDLTAITIPQTMIAFVGDDLELPITFNPSDATIKKVTLNSSQPTIANITEYGRVHPLTVGKTIITAVSEDGKKTTQCELTVTDRKISSISTVQNLKLVVGEKVQLPLTILPVNATNKNVIWTTDKKGIVTVSKTGVVTPLKVGKVKITATTIDGSKKFSTCTLVVTNTGNYSALKNFHYIPVHPGHYEITNILNIYPQLEIPLENLSSNEIQSLTFSFGCYDLYENPVGLFTNTNTLTLEKVSIKPGATYVLVTGPYDFLNFDGTEYIYNYVVNKVVYSNGCIWVP